MNLFLLRTHYYPQVIDGQLSIDGYIVCHTTENAKTAIPSGTYEVRIVKCCQYMRKMPVLLPTGGSAPRCSSCQKHRCIMLNSRLPRRCPMLKPGNGAYRRTDSSILLGSYVAPGCLKLPRRAFDELYERLRKSIERGHQVFITIE